MSAAVVLLGRRRGAIQAAQRLGLLPLVVTNGTGADDLGRHRWSRLFDDEAAMEEMVRTVAATTPVATVAATTEAAVVPAARLRAALGLPGLDVATAIRCTDKAAMKRAVRAAAIPCADYLTDTDGLDHEAIVARLGLPLVVKARAASGGRGTFVARHASEVPQRLPAGWMAESFVEGVEMSVESFVVDQTPLLENPTEYFRPGWANLLPAALDPKTWERVRAVNRAALRAVGIVSGVAHLELFVQEERVVFGEVTARPPGGYLMELIGRVYRFDPWEAWLATACGARPAVSATPFGAAGVWLFHPGEGRIIRIDGADRARALPGVVELVVRGKLGDTVAKRVGVGQEVGHVTVVGADRDQAAARLRAAHAAVRIEVSPP